MIPFPIPVYGRVPVNLRREVEDDMEGWWCVRYGDALARVEAPSEAAALRRSLELAPLTIVENSRPGEGVGRPGCRASYLSISRAGDRPCGEGTRERSTRADPLPELPGRACEARTLGERAQAAVRVALAKPHAQVRARARMGRGDSGGGDTRRGSCAVVRDRHLSGSAPARAVGTGDWRMTESQFWKMGALILVLHLRECAHDGRSVMRLAQIAG